MQFPAKIYLPFRLKLLLAFLASAGAGIYLGYSGLKSAAAPFAEQQAGAQLTARLDIAASVLTAGINADLERALRLALNPVLRKMLAGGQVDDKVLGRLSGTGGETAGGLSGLDLADAKGKVLASLNSEARGTDLSYRADFRLGIKNHYIGWPRLNGKKIGYDITVPVSAAVGTTTRPLGVLRCRFKAAPAQLAALEALITEGTSLALAKRGGQRILIKEGTNPIHELNLKAPKAAPFLAALESRYGKVISAETGAGKELYATRSVAGSEWVLAAKTPFSTAAQPVAALLEQARLNALLAFAFLATASFFAAGSLAGPLRGMAREAGALLAKCGRPAGSAERLNEPEVLAAAIAEAASALKQQSSRDLELETETEKLREEEADLKTQNDELEKLNKYLMEREIKISELKKEISELREKVGNSSD